MFFGCFLGFSQTAKTIEDLHKLYIQERNINLAKAQQYAEQAVELHTTEKNDSLYAISNYYLTEVLTRQGAIPEAVSSAETAVNYAKKSSNVKLTCLSYMALSKVNGYQGVFTEGLEHLEHAIQLEKKLGDAELLHKIHNRKGVLFERTKNKDKAINILKKSLLNPQFTNVDNIASTYHTLGGAYETIDKDSSVYFFEKALKTLSDSPNDYLKGVIHYNLGDVFIQLRKNTKGLEELKISEALSKKVSHNRGLYSINAAYAVYYHNQESYKKAIKKYLEALNLYSKYVDDSQRAHLYYLLSEALYFDQQYQEGFIYQDKYIDLKDSLFTVEKSKTFERLQTEYEVEKKNDQITHLQEKQLLETKQRKLILGVGGLVLAVLLLFVFIYRYRSKSQKIIREKEQQLFLQEKEQLQQSEKIKRIEGYIEGEEKEKNRIAMELHDGIGGQLAGIQHFVTTLPKNSDTGVLQQNITSVSKEVRLLSHSLSSSFSEMQPFTHLLHTLQSRYQNHFELQVHLYPEEEIKNLENAQKVFLYRSIQELVNNIYKHADASTIDLSLTISEEIVLVIEDDGRGFDIKNTPKGIGLQNIKEKTAYVKGEVLIDSKLGEGTTVIIKIPK